MAAVPASLLATVVLFVTEVASSGAIHAPLEDEFVAPGHGLKATNVLPVLAVLFLGGLLYTRTRLRLPVAKALEDGAQKTKPKPTPKKNKKKNSNKPRRSNSLTHLVPASSDSEFKPAAGRKAAARSQRRRQHLSGSVSENDVHSCASHSFEVLEAIEESSDSVPVPNAKMGKTKKSKKKARGKMISSIIPASTTPCQPIETFDIPDALEDFDVDQQSTPAYEPTEDFDEVPSFNPLYDGSNPLYDESNPLYDQEPTPPVEVPPGEFVNPLFSSGASDADDLMYETLASNDGSMSMEGGLDDDFNSTFDACPVYTDNGGTVAAQDQDEPDLLIEVFLDVVATITLHEGGSSHDAEMRKAFATFMKSVLVRASASSDHVVACIIFMQRLISKHPLLRVPAGTGHRVFVILLLIACKVLDDEVVDNQEWSTYTTEFSNQDLNKVELELLTQLEFDLYISRPEYDRVIQSVVVDARAKKED